MENSREIADQMVSMGKMSLEFARTNRVTMHEDGETYESDTDHSFMIALIAGSVADTYFPELDRGRVVEYAVLHDLVEVYAGDVPTFVQLTPEQMQKKKKAEHKALMKIQEQFGAHFPWIHETIESYEKKDVPESRFVKVMDKMMAKITHILNAGAATKRLGYNEEQIEEWRRHHIEWSDEHLAEFTKIRPLWDEIVDRACKTFKT